MRELTYFVAVSLDGFIAAPDGDFSAFGVEGDHIEMIARDWRDTLPAPALSAMGLTADRSRFDTVVMGWGTYEVGLPFGVDDPYPHLDQVVVTRAHAEHPFPDGVRTTDDPLGEVRRLKQQPGTGIWLCGGGALAGVLVDEIDRLVLKSNPLLLGEGLPLFAGAPDVRRFELVGSTSYRSGVVVSEYARTGNTS